MSKFKPGDKVRVVANTEGVHNFLMGTVGQVESVGDELVEVQAASAQLTEDVRAYWPYAEATQTMFLADVEVIE